MLALRRGWSGATTPRKTWPGYASTLNVTGWPEWMLPMSASLTDAHTCSRFRSLAIRNRLGALRLDTTVWPTLTRRSMMTPLTGDLIVQYPRLVSARPSVALARARLASALFSTALASPRPALAWAMAASPTATVAWEVLNV